MDSRETIQYNAIKAWIENDRSGTVVLPTGTGKTFVGATIACKQLSKNSIESVLIVVPTTVLIEQWKNEIIKFYGEEILSTKAINIVCIQTAFKHQQYADLLIVDEIHTALSDNYSKLFENTTYKQILGLTATIPPNEDRLNLLNKYAKVVYSKSLHEVSSEKVVSDYYICNLEVGLNRKDLGKYRIFDNLFKRAQMELGIIKYREPQYKEYTVFDLAKKFSTSKVKEPIVKYAKQYWSAMSMRKWVCYEAESKIPIVLSILRKFKGRKWIIFNKSIKFAEALSEVLNTCNFKSKVYHSKLKDEQRAKIIEEFEQGLFPILIAVDALNAGLNIPEVDSAISVSGVSTELTNVQQLGRIIRRQDDSKVALFINLYSKGTVEENWVKTKTKNFPNTIWVKTVEQCSTIITKMREQGKSILKDT